MGTNPLIWHQMVMDIVFGNDFPNIRFLHIDNDTQALEMFECSFHDYNTVDDYIHLAFGPIAFINRNIIKQKNMKTEFKL